jgi:hypothetical protein
VKKRSSGIQTTNRAPTFFFLKKDDLKFLHKKISFGSHLEHSSHFDFFFSGQQIFFLGFVLQEYAKVSAF